MSLLKANRLECSADIVQRGIFRLVWCTIPGLIIAFVASLFGYPQLVSLFVIVPLIAVPVLAVVVDGLRLKYRGSSDQ